LTSGVAREQFEAMALELAPRYALVLDERVLGRFWRHFALVLQWNQRTNLTGVTAVDEAVRRHYLESAVGASMLTPECARLFDVGSGAGFPGIPLACLRPELEVVLVESHGRKAAFLRDAIQALGLERVRVECGRFHRVELNERDAVAARALERFEKQAVALGRSAAGQVLLYANQALIEQTARRCRRVVAERRLLPDSNDRWVASLVGGRSNHG
jgi:16S rRNA (guanine527-N7)-methyltransferase